MRKLKKGTLVYHKDAMTEPKCLICGEHLGEYNYRGKNVCPACIEYIRANY
jgi:uncharacterized Zn finger protein (UPF0148 family)